MPSPFSSSGVVALNSLGVQANIEGQHHKVWDGLHVSPRTAPSKGAKLCTYFAWFFRPGQLHRWWSQVLGFMHRLSVMPEGSIHVDILKDNISAAQQHPMCGNWATGIVRQYASLGMPSPFSSSGIVALNSLGVQANLEAQHRKVWDGLHVSPRTAPSKGAKLCTYFAWFFRPGQLRFEPYISNSHASFQVEVIDAVSDGLPFPAC